MTPYRKGYLEGRAIKPATIEKFSGHIRSDQRGNVCFRHDDESGLTGWETKNRGFTGFAGGGNKALFLCQIGDNPPNTPNHVLAVTESGIDAMSYYQLNPADGLYMSIAGNMSPEQIRLLTATLTRYPQALPIIATGNDKEGEKYADIIRSIRPDAIRFNSPSGKDWNDALNERSILRV